MSAVSDGTVHDAHVVVRTAAFDADFAMLTERLGFRVDAIFPADHPSTAVVSAHGLRLRLEAAPDPTAVTIQLVVDEPGGPVSLPGGTRIECVPFDRPYVLPENRPSLTVSHDGATTGVGRAGMRYRDLIPDRWGGRFISSLISIPDGGPVPDYVHFHKIRFQLIFVKDGWVRVAYEDQGEPFVLERGDCVIQPPEIRHRVLEASPGLEVVEIGCPAEHETIADWSLPLPNGVGDPGREWDGQRFVRHVAAGAAYQPWRMPGWEYRESGVAAATGGLAGVRVARPSGADTEPVWIAHDHELSQLVVLRGTVTFEAEGRSAEELRGGSAVAIPGGTRYRLADPSDDCEVLDVTLPADPRCDTGAA
jgi:quercetin dioxygenase-like cupin family protein